MHGVRETREDGVRAKTTRKPWTPPGQRYEAPPCPKGYVQRWVRTSVKGTADAENITRRRRDGYEPVSGSAYVDSSGEPLYPVDDNGHISVGGSVLMRWPEESFNERAEYYRNATRSTTRALKKRLSQDTDGHGTMTTEQSTRKGRSKVSFDD